MRQHGRQEYQRVLGPLVYSDRSQPLACAAPRLRKGSFDLGQTTRTRGLARRPDGNGVMSGSPEVFVNPLVTHIVEPPFPEPLDERETLAFPAEIFPTVACQRFMK